MPEIVFLGTGGGRVVIVRQLRATGGFIISGSALRLHVDPGPGALVRCVERRQNAASIGALFVSHVHIDHSNDAGIIIEAMTATGRTPKLVLAAQSVLQGEERAISPYHQRMAECRALKAGDETKAGSADLTATKTEHTDAHAIGFKMRIDGKTIGYTSDTGYFEALSGIFKGCDALVLNCLRPAAERLPHHLCSEDAALLLSNAKPTLAILQHFGMRMLRAGPEAEAKRIEQQSGVRTIAAKDGMRVPIGDRLGAW